MTFSNGASGKLEYWSLPDTDPPRTVVVAPAWFAHYRPRRGLMTDWTLLRMCQTRCWKCTSQRPSLHLCAGKRAKSMAARRYLGGSPGAAASSALPATWGSLRPTSSVTGASNAVVSARGSKRLDQPGVRRIATGSRGEARAWKAKKNWGEEGEKLMRRVRDLGGYLMESTNRSLMERQLAERLRRAWKGFVEP